MAGISWRRLNFFSHTIAPAPEALTAPSAWCTLSDGGLAIGDAAGACHLLRRDLSLRATFMAHASGVTHLVQRGSLIISVGTEPEGGTDRAHLKVWKDEAASSEQAPTCARSLRIFGASAATASAPTDPADPTITCAAVADDLSQVAIGLHDGGVLLLRTTDVMRERFLRFKPLSSLPPDGVPITNLHFCYSQPQAQVPTELWVATAESLRCVAGGGLRSEACTSLNDGGGAAARCACVSESVSDVPGQLVLGRDEAIYLYGPDERGPCFAFDGAKRLLTWHASALVVVTASDERDEAGRVASSGGIGASFPVAGLGGVAGLDVLRDAPGGSAIGGVGDVSGGGGGGGGGGTHTLQLYDLKNKFIACHLRLSSTVRFALSCGHRLLVCVADGSLFTLEERPWAEKLALLYRKSLYPTAISLATAQQLGRPAIAAIHKEYAEHLYAKGDYAGAAEQFVHTVGEVPPSTVIASFLTAQRLRELTLYMLALHRDRQGIAAPQHTTLLMHCLCKLNDAAQVAAFVRWASTEGGLLSATSRPAFGSAHVAAAVEVLRSSGFADLAVDLAQARNETALLLSLLLDEAAAYDRALSIIQQMTPHLARTTLLTTARKLLDHRAVETSTLLATLCADLPLPEATNAAGVDGGQAKRSGVAEGDGTALDGASGEAQGGRGSDIVQWGDGAAMCVESFIHLFSAHQRSLLTFLAALVEEPNQPAVVANTLLGLYIAPDPPVDTPIFGSMPSDEETAPAPSEQATSPATPSSGFDAAFAAVEDSQKRDMSVASRRVCAMALLRRTGVRYSAERVLLLCLQYVWDEGQVLMLEKLGRYAELLDHQIRKRDAEALVRTCRRYSEAEPTVWLRALDYLVANSPPSLSASGSPDEGAEERAWRTQMGEVLSAIEADELQSPVDLLHRLCGGDATGDTSHRVPLGVVMEVLERQIRYSEAAATEQLREASRASEEISKMQAEIEDIDHGARVFQLAKCSACHNALETPTVHFLCMHSFHAACLGDHDTECPVCAPQRRRIAEHAQQQRTLARDGFFKQEQTSADAFGALAELIGRGMLIDVAGEPP